MEQFRRMGRGYQVLIAGLVLVGLGLGIQSGDLADVAVGLVLAGAVFAVGWWRSRTSRAASVMQAVTAFPIEVIALKGDGSYAVEVVGESHYQSALEAIAGGRTADSARVHADAVLILEDDNKYDPGAVRVEISGKTVGHLSREDAPAYRARLAAMGKPAARGMCHARIVGGWDRGEGERGNYGVYLDVELNDE